MIAAVITATFVLFYVLPGDAARVALGPSASEAAVAELRRSMGLDASVATRAWRYAAGLLRGDLGHSLISGRGVAALLAERFSVTAKVAALGSVFSLAGSYALVLAAHVFGWRLPARWAQAGTLLPSFAVSLGVALALLVVAPGLRFGGSGALESVAIPAFVASLSATAMLTTVLLGVCDAIASADFVRSLRAQGFGRLAVFHGGVLRAASPSWLTAWANQVSIVLVGTLVVEIAFSIPGAGALLLSAVEQRDFPVVGGIVVVNAVFFTVLWTVVTGVLRQIDPRVVSGE